jgi:hypothetical protein
MFSPKNRAAPAALLVGALGGWLAASGRFTSPFCESAPLRPAVTPEDSGRRGSARGRPPAAAWRSPAT